MKKRVKYLLISLSSILLIILSLSLISSQETCSNCQKICRLKTVPSGQEPVFQNPDELKITNPSPLPQITFNLPCNKDCYDSANKDASPQVVMIPAIDELSSGFEPFQPEDCGSCISFNSNPGIRPNVDIEFKNQAQTSQATQKNIIGNLQNQAANLLSLFSKENLPVEISIVMTDPSKKDSISKTFVIENNQKKLVLTISTSNKNNIEKMFKNAMERTLLTENGLNPDMAYCQNLDDVLKSTSLTFRNGMSISSGRSNNLISTLRDPKQRENYVIENLFDLALDNDMNMFKAFQANSILRSMIDEKYKGSKSTDCQKRQDYITLLKHLAEIRSKKDLPILQEDGKRILTAEAKNLMYETLRKGLGLEGTRADILKHIINTAPIPYLERGGCVFQVDFQY
jgi:hypothetical protein